jgi:hypothetical protein
MNEDDYWVNPRGEGFVDLPDVYAAIDAKTRDGMFPTCRTELKDAPFGYRCTRAYEHTGRHIAQGRIGVLCAWPGRQAPSMADVT